MNFFKFYLIVIILLAILNLGIFLRAEGHLKLISSIAPVEKWEEILTTNKWEFQSTEVYPMETVQYQGIVEYFNNGTFKKNVTCKIYLKEFPFKENSIESTYPDFITQGAIEGQWEIIDGKFWEEQIKDCGMKKVYCSYKCEERYGNPWRYICTGKYPKKELNFGTYENERTRMDFLKFTKNKILLHQKSLVDESKATISFHNFKPL